MGVLFARETPQDNFTPVSTMGVGLASQSQAGLMSVPDKVKLDGIDDEKLDGIADYIVDEGTSGIWTYRKWNSGIAECWGEQTFSGSLSAWGSWFSCDISPVAFPTNLFVAPPFENAQAVSSGGNGVGTMSGAGYSKDTSHYLVFVRPTNLSGTLYFRVFRHAKGRWK